jgi:hypothetical protein
MDLKREMFRKMFEIMDEEEEGEARYLAKRYVLEKNLDYVIDRESGETVNEGKEKGREGREDGEVCADIKECVGEE